MKKRTVEAIRKDIEAVDERISDLLLRGNEACSEYDLRFGYDASFNLKLALSHLASYEKELKEATKHGEQLTLF